MTPMLQLLFSAHDALREILPCALILTGSALHAYTPHYRLNVWERVRGHQLSAAAAHRAMAFVQWSAPFTTLLGLALLGEVCWSSLG